MRQRGGRPEGITRESSLSVISKQHGRYSFSFLDMSLLEERDAVDDGCSKVTLLGDEVDDGCSNVFPGDALGDALL